MIESFCIAIWVKGESAGKYPRLADKKWEEARELIIQLARHIRLPPQRKPVRRV